MASKEGQSEFLSSVLDERNLILNALVFPVEKVSPVSKQHAHALPCTKQNLMSIIVHMGLQIQDLYGFKEFAGLVGQLLRVSLRDASHLILLQLFLGEEQGPDMIEVFKLHPCEEVREVLKGHMRLPCLPYSSIIEGNWGLLKDAQGELLHGIEKGPFLGGWTWTDTGDRRHSLLVRGEMNTDGESKSLVSLVPAGRRHRDGADVPFVQPQRSQGFP